MSVPIQTPLTVYTGNGVTTAFAYQFLLLSADDAEVYIDGVEKTPGVDYAVSGVQNPAGGTITFTGAPGSGTKVVLRRNVGLSRLTDYQYSGPFQSDTVNKDFDRIWMALQDYAQNISTALRLPPDDNSNPLLPSVASRALMTLGFDASGQLTLVPTTAGDATALALALASSLLNTQGAGLTAFNPALAYAAGTVGAAIKPIADFPSITDVAKGAALVGYKLNATGSVGRTLAAKLLDDISVKDFGAVGDGVANDTAAFNAAVAYLLSVGGGILRVPRGNYKTTSAISITTAGIRIVGAGRSSTFMLPATNTDCFIFSQSGGFEWGVQDMSIRYTGNQTTASAINAGGVGVAAVNGCIKNIYIERCYNGIVVGNSQGTVIDTVQMWYFTGAGIYSADGLNDLFLHNLFLNGAAYGTATPNAGSIGLNFNGKAHGIMCSHIEVIQCFCPMQLIGTGSLVLRPAFSTFTDCFFDSSSTPVRLAYCRDIKFVGCWFSQRSTGCIVDINCYGTKFVGCSFTNNDATGCLVTSTALFTSFVDCTFDSNGSITTANGLTIDANVTDVKVIGGYFGNLGGFASLQQAGIALLAGVNRILIQGATFQNNAITPVAMASAATLNSLQEFVIRDCTGYITKKRGTATIPTGTAVSSFSHGLAYTPTFVGAIAASGQAVSVYQDTAATNTTTLVLRSSSNVSGDMFVNWTASCFNG